MQLDYPLIRETTCCPACLGEKDRGLVLCWECNGKLKAWYNKKWYNEKWANATERLLHIVEKMLASYRDGNRGRDNA